MTQKTVCLTKKQEKVVNGDKQLLVPIFKTDDYDKFLLVESNRFIRPNKIATLRVEIERNDLTDENEIKLFFLIIIDSS